MCAGRHSRLCALATGCFWDGMMCSMYHPRTINGVSVLVGCGAISEDDAYQRLRVLSYPGSDLVVLVCTGTDPSSLLAVEDVWLPEVKNHLTHTPCVLVALGTVSDEKAANGEGVSSAMLHAFARKFNLEYLESTAMLPAESTFDGSQGDLLPTVTGRLLELALDAHSRVSFERRSLLPECIKARLH